MRGYVESLLMKSWRRRGGLSRGLLPLSWLYGALSACHLRRAARHAWKAPVPVIVIGNILVGGTGKTPLAIAVCRALQRLGWRPGVVSRGYGIRTGRAPHLSDQASDSAWLGDEPALLHAQTAAPIGVHPSRVRAAQALLGAHPEVNLLIADDGLQHRALARDIEIVVQDQRGVGNGRLLPAGPLREPASRLLQADWLVTHVDAKTSLPCGTAAAARGKPRRIAMQLQAHSLTHLASGRTQDWTQWLAQRPPGPVSAIAGIGQPQRFFTMLKAAGLTLQCAQALGDHQAIDPAQLRKLPRGPVLTTAKDAVKCSPNPDPRLWAVHVNSCFSDPDWFMQLDRRLRSVWPGPAHKPGIRH